MKSKKSRILSLALAVGMLASMGGCGKDKNTGKQGTDGAVFGPDTTVQIVVGSHVSWPYNENWVMWKYFREAVGGNLEISAIPSQDLATKVPLMLASPETLPDLLHTPSKNISDTYALSGAFIPIDDVEQEMPNYTAFWDSVPAEKREVLMAERLAGNGKIYSAPVYGMDMDNMQIWMYRKDILDQHGLTPPTTMDELYQVCKKLKALYPNSYPLCLRSGLNTMALIGPEWTPYFNPFVYYDYGNKEWKYGAVEPAMREIVDYLIKMEDEGLVPPDFMTITTKGWEELVSTDRGFFMPDFLVRVDYFTPTARLQNPNFTLEIMAPPKAETATGQSKIARNAADATGYVLCNSGDQGRIQNAVKLLDWMYSDEAAELLSWGKEGETYEIKDGKRKFLVQGDENPRSKYGVLTLGLYERVAPEANTASMSDEQSAMVEVGAQYLEERRNPKFWMAFSDEEMKRREQLRPEIEAYTEEMLSKFILEMEPMSHWDTFQSTLRQMGVEELLDVHRSAFARVEAAK